MAALDNHSLFFCSWCRAQPSLFAEYFPFITVTLTFKYLKDSVLLKRVMKKMLVSQESNKSKRRVWSKTQGGVRRVKDQERNFWPYNRLLRVRTDMTHLPATCILGRCKSTCHFLGQYFPCKTGNIFSVSIRPATQIGFSNTHSSMVVLAKYLSSIQAMRWMQNIIWKCHLTHNI